MAFCLEPDPPRTERNYRRAPEASPTILFLIPKVPLGASESRGGSLRRLGIGETATLVRSGPLPQRLRAPARRTDRPRAGTAPPYNLDIGVELAFRIVVVERKLDRDDGMVSCEDEECASNSMDRNVNIIFAAVFEATPAALSLTSLL